MTCLNNGRKRAVVTFQNSRSCGDHLCVAWPEITALRLFVLGWKRRHENFHIYRHLRWHTAVWISGCGCCGSYKQHACFLKERLPSALQLGHRQIPLHYECIIHKVARCDQHSFIHAGTLPPPASSCLLLPLLSLFLDYLRDSWVKTYLQAINGCFYYVSGQQDVLGWSPRGGPLFQVATLTLMPLFVLFFTSN